MKVYFVSETGSEAADSKLFPMSSIPPQVAPVCVNLILFAPLLKSVQDVHQKKGCADDTVWHVRSRCQCIAHV